MEVFWPLWYHLHLKQGPSGSITLDRSYRCQLTLTNELDMFRGSDIAAHCPLPIMLEIMWLSRDEQEHAAVSALGLRAAFAAAGKPPGIAKNGQGQFDITFIVSHPQQIKLLRASAAQAPLTFLLKVSVGSDSPVAPRILAATTPPLTLNLTGSGSNSASVAAADEHDHDHNDEKTDAGGGSLRDGAYHAFPVLDADPKRFVVIKEVCGTSLGARIWDSALYFRRYFQQVLAAKPSLFDGKTIVELGSGTGSLGIWLWAVLRDRYAAYNATKSRKDAALPATAVYVTDLAEVMDLLHENVRTNIQLAQHDDANGVSLKSTQLTWGVESEMASIPHPADVILVCDCMYNPKYFDILLQCLAALSSPNTLILIAYRTRGANENHDELFFQRLPSFGFTYTFINQQKGSTDSARVAAANDSPAAVAATKDVDAKRSTPTVVRPAMPGGAAAAKRPPSIRPAARTAAKPQPAAAGADSSKAGSDQEFGLTVFLRLKKAVADNVAVGGPRLAPAAD